MYISNKEVIGTVAGIIYRMHPYHNPENINVIITKIIEYFDNNVKEKEKDNTFKLLSFKDWNEFTMWIKEFLMGIKEFRQLNISKKLKDAGVDDIDDDRNKGIHITTIHSVQTNDSRYSDFVDLDACIQNIVNELATLKESSDDCFLCLYAKEYGSMEPANEICETCICNPKIKYNRVPHPMSLKPRKDWTEEEKIKYNLD